MAITIIKDPHDDKGIIIKTKDIRYWETKEPQHMLYYTSKVKFQVSRKADRKGVVKKLRDQLINGVVDEI